MSDTLPCKLISWDDFYDLCRILANQIRDSGYRVDMIVAIGRGGYFPGRILSDMLNVRNLTSFKIEHYQSAQRSANALVKYPLSANVDRQRILLVDDVSDSGDTFQVAIEHVNKCGPVREIRTAVIHHKTVSRFKPDYFAEVITEWNWLLYPWAVNEDLANFICALQPASKQVDTIQKQLSNKHGITLTRRQIEDALILIDAGKDRQFEH